jgi:hypothetical protein
MAVPLQVTRPTLFSFRFENLGFHPLSASQRCNRYKGSRNSRSGEAQAGSSRFVAVVVIAVVVRVVRILFHVITIGIVNVFVVVAEQVPSVAVAFLVVHGILARHVVAVACARRSEFVLAGVVSVASQITIKILDAENVGAAKGSRIAARHGRQSHNEEGNEKGLVGEHPAVELFLPSKKLNFVFLGIGQK